MNDQKEYSNGEITIVWKAGLCIHSANCWRGANGLIGVFNPKDRPWINPNGATTERIVAQIARCPSGALSYYRNETEPDGERATDAPQIVEVRENGPLLVYGNITVREKDGSETAKQNATAFCRCGRSNNKPYCDGSHTAAGFTG